ncbi:MAG: hypothetical protein JRJ42_10855 [Deltaproteobacteria bacterium]|nr:hypothetical protein [Deltaproteobacteria bacterium]MBW2021074.1 hypothetical protein [Deltaproteobacteria bacterium]MBW2075759.1 hypothetical protein [Deltaproteobacteria bacterium]RLB79851.1 MAG: hypothetical protein DRH17_13035 [Deltaproteobacteria bacterium]
MKISRTIWPLIEDTANKIFVSYNTKLLAEPITYIVPAVWGAAKEGELTPTQKDINKKVAPVIEKVFESLQLKHLSGAQAFAIRFIIRGLIISRITYMIEAVKSKMIRKVNSGEQDTDMLNHLEPMGNA